MNREPVSGKTCRMRNMQIHQLGFFRRSYQIASWHSRISRRTLWAILFISLFPVYCLAGEGKPIRITLVADHTKANGEPWDFRPWRGARYNDHPQQKCAAGSGGLHRSFGNASGMQHAICELEAIFALPEQL